MIFQQLPPQKSNLRANLNAEMQQHNPRLTRSPAPAALLSAAVCGIVTPAGGQGRI
jgi:hypothetical protein